MSDVTIRDLRNRGGHVLDQVVRGETLTVTRDGKPVAELRPLDRAPLSAEILLSRWQRLPRLDAGRLKADIEAVLNSTL
jgi:prevent-host-death family protein